MDYTWNTTAPEDLGLVNASITHVLAHTMPALKTIVDSGAKNKIKNISQTTTTNGITFTVNSDGTITASGTATANASIAINASDTSLINVSLVASGCPKGGSSSTYRAFIQKMSGSTYATVATLTGDDVFFELDTSQYRYLITVYNGYTADGLVFKPMICSKDEWLVSKDYVPYRPSYAELVARVEALEE